MHPRHGQARLPDRLQGDELMALDRQLMALGVTRTSQLREKQSQTTLHWGELYRSVQSSIKEQLLSRNVKRFRGGIVFKAHRLLHDSAVGLSMKKKKKRESLLKL